MVAVVGKDSGSDSQNAMTSKLTNSIASWATGSRGVVVVGTPGNTTGSVTLTGGGVTWSLVDFNDDLNVFVSSGTPTAGQLLISEPVQDGLLWDVYEVTGFNPASFIVNFDQAAVAVSATGGSVTMSPTPDSGNAIFASCLVNTQLGINPGSGFTELAEIPMSGPSRTLQSQWRTDGVATVSWTWNEAASGRMIALEIGNDTGGGPPPDTSKFFQFLGA